MVETRGVIMCRYSSVWNALAADKKLSLILTCRTCRGSRWGSSCWCKPMLGADAAGGSLDRVVCPVTSVLLADALDVGAARFVKLAPASFSPSTDPSTALLLPPPAPLLHLHHAYPAIPATASSGMIHHHLCTGNTTAFIYCEVNKSSGDTG